MAFLKFDGNIPNDWVVSFQNFENRYIAKILSYYQKSATQIKITDGQHLNNPLLHDSNNPLQFYIHKDEVYFIFSENDIPLSSTQREALIAHEIGHWIYNNSELKDQELEEACDQVAVILDISSDLKEALTILKDHLSKNLELLSCSLQINPQSTIKALEKRIEKL